MQPHFSLQRAASATALEYSALGVFPIGGHVLKISTANWARTCAPSYAFYSCLDLAFNLIERPPKGGSYDVTAEPGFSLEMNGDQVGSKIASPILGIRFG